MAWEKRKTAGSPYFYLSRRDASGRVRKVYLGKGSDARRVADSIARKRAESAADREQMASKTARLAAVDGLMKELEVVGGLLFEAFLLSQGFYRHNYGTWRKRRGHGGHQ